MTDNMLPIPTPEQCAQDLRDDGFHPEATLVERMAREASYHQQELNSLLKRSRIWQDRAEKAEAENERLRGLLDFAIEMTVEPDCWYDHHGYCQAHNLQPKGECWVELAKKGADQ